MAVNIRLYNGNAKTARRQQFLAVWIVKLE